MSSDRTNILIVAGGGGGSAYVGSGTSHYGQGENATNIEYAGGGGGFYGGKSGFYNAAGGSGYIGNTLLTNKSMYCYNCTKSDEISTKTISNTCANSSPTENCSKLGNGYAKITYLGAST